MASLDRDHFHHLTCIADFLALIRPAKLFYENDNISNLEFFEADNFFTDSHSEKERDEWLVSLLREVSSRLKHIVLRDSGNMKSDFLRKCWNSESREQKLDFLTYGPINEVIGFNVSPAMFFTWPTASNIFAQEENSSEETKPIRSDFDPLGGYVAQRTVDFEKALSKRIEEFEGAFAGCLTFHRFFFESEERASWLREFCVESDRHFGLVDSTVPFFGTGTALELFESNLQEN